MTKVPFMKEGDRWKEKIIDRIIKRSARLTVDEALKEAISKTEAILLEKALMEKKKIFDELKRYNVLPYKHGNGIMLTMHEFKEIKKKHLGDEK